MKQKVAILLLLIGYGLLYPGLTQPILSITGFVEKADLVEIGKDLIIESPDTPPMIDAMAEILVREMQVEGTVEAYQKTRSILGTVKELYNDGNFLVSFLIMLFSVVVPALKGGLVAFSYFIPGTQVWDRLQLVSGAISKWSMADVFVIGVFVSFLAANAVENEGGLLSFDATLKSGFYFFLSYCLLSVASSQLLSGAPKDQN